MIGQKRPDLVLLDLMLPGINGIVRIPLRGAGIRPAGSPGQAMLRPQALGPLYFYLVCGGAVFIATAGHGPRRSQCAPEDTSGG